MSSFYIAQTQQVGFIFNLRGKSRRFDIFIAWKCHIYVLKNKQTQDTIYPKTSIMFLLESPHPFFPCVKKLLEVNPRGDTLFKKYPRMQVQTFKCISGRAGETPGAFCDVPCWSSVSAEHWFLGSVCWWLLQGHACASQVWGCNRDHWSRKLLLCLHCHWKGLIPVQVQELTCPLE